MPRSRSHTRRKAKSYARGTLFAQVAGHAYVRTPEGEYFIPHSKINGAFDGDTVEVASLSVHARKASKHTYSPGSYVRPAARVVRVLERAHEVLIGRYEICDPFGIVVPEDPRIPYDIFTQHAEHPEIKEGSLVRVRIRSYPSYRSAATGVVEEVLEANSSQVAIENIIARHKLISQFSSAALTQASQARLECEAALNSGYADLRKRLVFTIDPFDAKDFDDAISLIPLDESFDLARLEEGRASYFDPKGTVLPRVLYGAGWEQAGRPQWCLGVHIADVSAYLDWSSPLDLDARQRATSTYLPDRVIPMLPAALSEELCSLRPDEDRLSMTVDLYLDRRGRLASYLIYPALIRSRRAYNYDEVLAILESRKDDALKDLLASASELAELRGSRRFQAGGLNFSFPEAKLQLKQDGKVEKIYLRRKNRATSLVEEAMILANEAVARILNEESKAALFRVHEAPSFDSLLALIPLLSEFTWFSHINTSSFVAGDAKTLQEVLTQASKHPESDLVSQLLLRSMKRAVYSEKCEGHYGLQSKAYTHFTSPIRRYPDLVAHRMLKAALFGRSQSYSAQVDALAYLAKHCSSAERAAEAVAAESLEYKLIEYLEDKVGEAFSGIVSGVASHGLYVRLENTAEGLLPIRQLGSEYFSFDANLYRLEGEESGKIWRLGQRIAVVLSAADARRNRLEFRLAGTLGS